MPFSHSLSLYLRNYDPRKASVNQYRTDSSVWKTHSPEPLETLFKLKWEEKGCILRNRSSFPSTSVPGLGFPVDRNDNTLGLGSRNSRDQDLKYGLPEANTSREASS